MIRRLCYVLSLSILITTHTISKAQSGSPILCYKNDLPTPSEVEQIRSRKLVIMKARWDADVVEEYKRLKEFSLLEEYKDLCAAYSDAYTTPLASYWSLHDSTALKSYIEIRNMLEAGEKDVMVLALVRVNIKLTNDDKKEISFSYTYTGEEEANDAKPYDPLSYKALVLFPIEALEDFPSDIKKMYLGVSLPRQVPTETDLIYAVDIMNDIVKRKTANTKFSDNMLKEFAPRLKEYTLAISKDNWEPSYLLREAAEYYPLPVEKVEPEKFTELIRYGMPGYAIGYKVGNFTVVMFSDTREIAYIQGPMDIPSKKSSKYFNNRDFHKIYEAVTGERVTFKESK